MREIKCRVWDKPRKKFAKQITNFKFNRDGNINLVVYLDKANKTQKITEQEKIYTNEFEVLISTGFKDKNGVEIYEGDIIKFGKSTFIVKYCKEFASFKKFFSDDCATDLINSPELYEVIGNIYENPELLEQESED